MFTHIHNLTTSHVLSPQLCRSTLQGSARRISTNWSWPGAPSIETSWNGVVTGARRFICPLDFVGGSTVPLQLQKKYRDKTHTHTYIYIILRMCICICIYYILYHLYVYTHIYINIPWREMTSVASAVSLTTLTGDETKFSKVPKGVVGWPIQGRWMAMDSGWRCRIFLTPPNGIWI